MNHPAYPVREWRHSRVYSHVTFGPAHLEAEWRHSADVPAVVVAAVATERAPAVPLKFWFCVLEELLVKSSFKQTNKLRLDFLI